MTKFVDLITGNQQKIAEAQAACKPFDILVNQLKLEIDEIQHHDPLKISQHKARKAFEIAGKPIVINDSSWMIPALKGFPGGYMKDVSSWFEPEDFINLMASKSDKRIGVVEIVIYKDKDGEEIFKAEYWGTIVEPRGSGETIERVAEFNGNTIGECRDQGIFVYDPKDYIWNHFAEWFSKQDLRHQN